MTGRVLPEAQWDVLDLSDWYDRHDPGSGDRFVEAARATFGAIATQPLIYGRVDSAPRGREIREMVMDGSRCS